MKVLMTADTVGGVWTYALELARSLARHDVHVELATFGRPPARDQRLEAAAIANLRLHESAFRLEWMREPWHDVRRGTDWLLELEALLAPDVLHLNGYAHASADWRAPAVVVAHSCVCSWWRAVRREEAPAEYDRYRRAVAGGLAAADLVVAPTRAMLDALEAHYAKLPRTRVVPNGRDPLRYLRRPKEPYVLAAGRVWDEAKNLGALGEVAPSLRWPVFIAGDDRHPDGGRKVLDGVHTLGRLTEASLARWYSAAGIFAHPARYEPFGLAPLEAGLSGCALVLGDLPSLREVWDDAALYVDADDADALRDAIGGLIADDEARVELARSAARRALRYTPRAMADAYVDTYRGLLAERWTPAARQPLEGVA